jgi:hypothetical protein
LQKVACLVRTVDLSVCQRNTGGPTHRIHRASRRARGDARRARVVVIVFKIVYYGNSGIILGKDYEMANGQA